MLAPPAACSRSASSRPASGGSTRWLVSAASSCTLMVNPAGIVNPNSSWTAAFGSASNRVRNVLVRVRLREQPLTHRTGSHDFGLGVHNQSPPKWVLVRIMVVSERGRHYKERLTDGNPNFTSLLAVAAGWIPGRGSRLRRWRGHACGAGSGPFPSVPSGTVEQGARYQWAEELRKHRPWRAVRIRGRYSTRRARLRRPDRGQRIRRRARAPAGSPTADELFETVHHLQPPRLGAAAAGDRLQIAFAQPAVGGKNQMCGRAALFVNLDRKPRRNGDTQLLLDRPLRIAEQPSAKSVSSDALPTICIRISFGDLIDSLPCGWWCTPAFAAALPAASPLSAV